MRAANGLNCRRRKPNRRGVAVIVALGLLAITLTVSYTLLRTQATARMIQSNASRANSARQAALVGLQIALKKIHDPSWQGVAVALSGSLSPTDSYAVTFTTGDAQLSETDDDYAEYPYRLTIQSTGTSLDPTDANRRAQHTTETVVQLVRERLADAPASWSDLTANTLTQWGDEEVELNFPARVEGPVRINGELEFCENVPPQLRPFDGLIDEVAVLDEDISESDLEEIYDGERSYASHWHNMRRWYRFNESAGAAVAADATGNGAGIFEGATAGETPSPFGGSGSARFDGEVDGVSLESFDVVSDELTLMAWIKADDFGESEARIISKSNGTDESDHWWMLSTYKFGNVHRLRFRLKTYFGTETLTASSGNLSPNQWYFVAATYDDSRMRLYLNGEEVGDRWHLGWVASNSNVPVWIGDNAPGNARGQYFRHLKQMADAGNDDHRMFNDTLTVRSDTLSEAERSLLSEELGVTIIDDPAASAADYSSFSPPAVTEYRLYPGGAAYAIPAASITISNQTLEANVVTNPLGVHYASNDIDLRSGAEINGVLLVTKDLQFDGTGIALKGVDIPPLHGSTERIQLPCLCVGRDMEFLADSTVQGEGMIVVADTTEFHSDDAAMTATLSGRLATKGLEIEPRLPWASYSSTLWNLGVLAFELQRRSVGGHAYFPAWLASQGLPSDPHFKITPPSDTIRYHWHDWSQPLYLPASDGGGLRWDIVRWAGEG